MVALIVAGLSGSGLAAPLNAGETDRPNVVVLITDDQDLDSLPVMRNLLDTPDGSWVNFTNAFASNAICAPSRASLLTGQRTYTHGVLNNNESLDLDDTAALPVWFDDAGYETALIGKYLNVPWEKTANYIPPGWDVFQNVSNVDRDIDKLNQWAVDFIETTTDAFFLLVTYNAPHRITDPPDRYADTAAYVPPDRLNFMEEDMSDKPPGTARALNGVEIGWREERLNGQRELLAVDDGIELIIEALQAKGELDNTLIVFASDHGYSWGSHQIIGKNCQYEECNRVPFFVRYPGELEAYREEAGMVTITDIAPTVADFAGVEPQVPQDGRSFLPLLSQGATTWLNEVLLERHQAPFYGIQTPEWKYVKHAKDRFPELYDLVNDPYELDNLAFDPAKLGIVRQLNGQLRRLISPDSTEAAVLLSLKSKGKVGDLNYDDEDIIRDDNGIWSLAFDGSDVGLAGADIDAFDPLADGSLLLSFEQAANVPGLGTVDAVDIVRFIPDPGSTGAATSGTFQWYVDGSDVGLTLPGQNIDAISLVSQSGLVLSTTAATTVGSVPVDKQDLVLLTVYNFGRETTGAWSPYFDSSRIGLGAAANDIVGSWFDPSTDDLYLLTAAEFDLPGAHGKRGDVIRCPLESDGVMMNCKPGPSLAWVSFLSDLVNPNVDGLAFDSSGAFLPQPLCYQLTVSSVGQGTLPVASPVKSDDCASDGRYIEGEVIDLSGASPASDWLLTGWTGTSNDGSTAVTNQLTMPAADHTVGVSYAYAQPIYVSPLVPVRVNDTLYQDEDILEYDPTTGDWSLYFDGSDVGLAARDVNGFLIVDEDEILLTFDNPVANLNGLPGTVDDSDIVRFTATNLGDVTDGSFALEFDGSAVGLTTGGEDIDAIAYDASGNLVISTFGNGKAGTLSFADEDLLRYDDTTETFELYFDGSQIDSKLRDVTGSWIDATTDNILFAVDKKWVFGGVTYNTYDILSCTPASADPVQSCSSLGFFWQGADHGFGLLKNKIDGLSLGAP